jgi:hypothetical protein
MMMIQWTASLILAATPATVVSVSNLEESLPRIKTAMDWAAKAKPTLSPKRTNKFLELVKINLFDVRLWPAVGLDKKGIVYVWSLPDQRSIVIELPVKSPSKFDGQIKLTLAANAETKKIIDASGLWTSRGPGQLLAVLRIKRRAFIQIDQQAGGFNGRGPVAIFESLLRGKAPPEPKKVSDIYYRDARLEPIRNIVSHRKPKVTAKQRKRGSAIWVHRLDRSRTYFSGPITLNDRGVDVSILVKDSKILQGDLLSAIKPQKRSRRLFDTQAIDKVAGELLVHLSPAGMRDFAATQGLGEDVAKTWTGEFHIVLMQTGALLAGVPIRKEASAAMLKRITQALKTYDTSLQEIRVEAYRGERVWLMWWGDVSSASMKKLLLKNKPVYGEGLTLKVDPAGLLEGLKQRSLAQDKMRVPGAQMLLLELVFGDLMKSTRRMKSQIMVSPAQAEVAVQLEY